MRNLKNAHFTKYELYLYAFSHDDKLKDLNILEAKDWNIFIHTIIKNIKKHNGYFGIIDLPKSSYSNLSDKDFMVLNDDILLSDEMRKRINTIDYASKIEQRCDKKLIKVLRKARGKIREVETLSKNELRLLAITEEKNELLQKMEYIEENIKELQAEYDSYKQDVSDLNKESKKLKKKGQH